MKQVCVIGVGTTSFRARNAEKTFRSLLLEVVKKSLGDAGIAKADIDHVVYSIHSEAMLRQQIPTLILQDYLGFQGYSSTRIEAGAATEGYALAAACARIRSGMDDVVLLAGVQKTSDYYDLESGSRELGFASGNSISTDAIWLQPLLPGPEAFLTTFCTVPHAERHGGPSRRQLAQVALKNRRNAALNPEAQHQSVPTLDEILSARMIADPITALMSAATSDGAVAVILASEEFARELGTREPVYVDAVSVSTHSSYRAGPDNIGRIIGTQIAARRAYERAGISDPATAFDLAQVHDLTSGIECVAYEELGFCQPGDAARLIDEGVCEADGALPVNVDGGRIGCGHAGGVSGLFAIGEIVRQLQQRAGPRQVRIDRGRALLQCTDAHLSNNAVGLFSIRENHRG